jgi:uncharacterized protein YeaO (DUF488 family)
MKIGMIQIKHFLDTPALEDGVRIWVEPFGVTRDLRLWCRIDDVLPQIGPPLGLWNWFDRHPDGYEYFRGLYHDRLTRGTFAGMLRKIEHLGQIGTVTLLHQGENPRENTASAVREFLAASRLAR